MLHSIVRYGCPKRLVSTRESGSDGLVCGDQGLGFKSGVPAIDDDGWRQRGLNPAVDTRASMGRYSKASAQTIKDYVRLERHNSREPNQAVKAILCDFDSVHYALSVATFGWIYEL